MEWDFLEISGEDDSLLQQIPTLHDTVTTSGNYLSCSPLQLPISNRSKDPPRVSPMSKTPWHNHKENLKEGLLTDILHPIAGDLKVSVDSAKSRCSSPNGGSNKENVNMIKSEVQKLSLEPLQMKRKRKGGNYNLRKSLAWDRAFFTEEGVLNPIELSMLSGTFGSSSEEALSVVNEEDREYSSYCDSNYIADSTNVQTLEEHLFKEIPAAVSHIEREKGGCLPPKCDLSVRYNTALTHVAKGRVLTNSSGVSTGSKGGGCPRPLASSSYPFYLCYTIGGDLKVSVDSAKSRCSSPNGGSNKENVNMIKSEVQKLSLEPLQMKRKRKGGNYNLRKSLAWDRAFFTEEGVLNPIELSMLSGTFGSSSEEALSVVNEEDREYSSYCDSNYIADSTNVQTLEEHLFKEIPAAVSHIEREKGGCLPPKCDLSVRYNTALTHVAKGRVLTNSSGVSTGSKGGGCPRPLASSSYPFYLCYTIGALNPTKASTKESKIPKIPVLKTASCSLPSTTKSNISNVIHFKHHLIAQPGRAMYELIIAFRRSGSYSSMFSCWTDEANPLAEKQSSTNPQRQANKGGLENTRRISGNMQSGQTGTIKPSGLRMPSPSLGFFSQPKASVSHSLSQRNIPARNNSKYTALGLLQNKVPIVCPRNQDSSKNDSGNSHHMSLDNCEMHTISVSGREGTVEHQREDDKFYISLSFSHGSARHFVQQSKEEAEFIKSCNVKGDGVSQWENHCLKAKDSLSIPPVESEKNGSTNVTDADSKAPECSGNDLKNSFVSSQHEYTEQENETAAGVDILSDELHVGDAQLQASNENLSVEICNSNWYTLTENTPHLEAGDLSEQLGEQVQLQSPCLAVQNNKQYDHALSDKSISFAEITCSEELQGEKIIESALFVVPEKNVDCKCVVPESSSTGRMQDDGVDKDHLAEQPPIEEAILDSGDTTGTHFWHDVKLKGVVTPSGFDVSLSKGSGLLVQDTQTFSYGSTVRNIGVDGMVSDVMVKEAEAKISLDDSYLKIQRMEENCGILFEESRGFEESQKYYLESPIGPGHKDVEFGSSPSPSQFKVSEDVKEGSGHLDSMINSTHMGDTEVQSLDGTLSTSAVYDQCLEIVHCNKQLEELESPDASLVAKHDSLGNHGRPLTDSFLPLEGTNYEVSLEENVWQSVAVVGKQSDNNGVESKSSNDVTQVLGMQGGGVGVNKMDDHPQQEDALSISAGTKTPPDMDRCGQVISSEFDSALKTSKYQIIGVTNPSTECSSAEKLVLLNEGDWTLSGSSQVSIEVDGSERNILIGKTETKISGQCNSPIGELHHELDNANCLTKDKEATMSIKKSENGERGDNLIIRPPPDAVPFSDEWLAAIEAAGEDILTMKGGAVQNSPPDKCLPEPGPWSPVKRKNNEIGPYDCTKFTNILPLDPH
ncbi:unnamed protein product [Ilex paraguariensis]|uniref:Uncharacterized protein n=1 Tax=Ilex paraguariensis TaxID=185542 RepID=A0ABC8TIA6_9AQUA